MTQHQKRIERMAQRREHGLKHKEIGEEFGLSRQHVGTLLRKNAEKDDCDAE